MTDHRATDLGAATDHPAQTRCFENRKATMADVAYAAGVSMMTVSRVVNGSSNVKRATSDRVSDAIRLLNYQPNSENRKSVSDGMTRIGLLCTQRLSENFSDILVGVLRESLGGNVQLVVLLCQNADDKRSWINVFSRNRLDGAFVTWPLGKHEVLIDALEHAKLPYLSVTNQSDPTKRLTVPWEDRRAACLMTQHLLDLGHQRICFVGGRSDDPTSIQCLQGYRDALAERGMPQEPELVAMNYHDYRAGLNVAEEILSGNSWPTAIFASTDEVAAAIIAIAHGRGLDVPADLTVCGFGDTALGSSIWPKLTTMRRPIADVAQQAMQSLIHQVRHREQSHDIAVNFSLFGNLTSKHRLIRRQSDAAPRTRPR